MSSPPDDLYRFRFEFSIGAVDRRRQLVPYRAENEKDLADRSVSTLRWYIRRWVVYGEPACAFFREKFEESYSCGACVLVCACMQIVVWNIMGNVAVKAVCFALRNIMKVYARVYEHCESVPMVMSPISTCDTCRYGDTTCGEKKTMLGFYYSNKWFERNSRDFRDEVYLTK